MKLFLCLILATALFVLIVNFTNTTVYQGLVSSPRSKLRTVYERKVVVLLTPDLAILLHSSFEQMLRLLRAKNALQSSHGCLKGKEEAGTAATTTLSDACDGKYNR